jgi:two-component system, OmpR family, KDP operon response regulator KdpE
MERASFCIACHCLLEDTVQGDCELKQMSSDQQKTLVIAEETSASSQLRRTLEVLGFDAAGVLSYEDALSCLRLFDYDAILLECSVFGRNVTAVCRELRTLYPAFPSWSLVSIHRWTTLLLFSRLAPTIMRSCHLPIRRFRTPALGVAERFVAGEIVLDAARHRVEKSGVLVPLSPTEFRALEVLMHRPGIPISHSALIATLWGLESQSTRKRLRVLIRALRKKLENNPSNPRYLKTYACIGYYFQDRDCAM